MAAFDRCHFGQLRRGRGIAADGCPRSFHFVGGNRAMVVAPRSTDVSQHGGEVGVGQARAHRRHGQIPITTFDLNRTVETGQGNARQRRDILGHPFGAGELRRLAGFAEAVAAVAHAAGSFIDRPAMRQGRAPRRIWADTTPVGRRRCRADKPDGRTSRCDGRNTPPPETAARTSAGRSRPARSNVTPSVQPQAGGKHRILIHHSC